MATVKVLLFSANRFIVRGFGQKATGVKLCAMYRGDLNKSLVRGGVVYLDGASVPASVNVLLRKGPKFALVPRLPRHELLATVRDISAKVPVEKRERCLSEGLAI
ncbi:hypothetical protein MTO96_036922 [Rhipicephalus appendiculatus]